MSAMTAAAVGAAPAGAAATAQRRSSFAGKAAPSRARVQAQVSSIRRPRRGAAEVVSMAIADPAVGGTTISDSELGADAASGNPLIGIMPDRVPMVEAGMRGELPGTFSWTKQWYPVVGLPRGPATWATTHFAAESLGHLQLLSS